MSNPERWTKFRELPSDVKQRLEQLIPLFEREGVLLAYLERGLIAAASIVFDVADQVLAGHFGTYVDTYEESLQVLCEEAVISEGLYR